MTPERFPAKWMPVRRKKTRQIKNPERIPNSTEAGTALNAVSGFKFPSNAIIGLVVVAAAAASLVAAPGGRGALGAGLACLMIAIAVADARRYIIPDLLTAPAFLLGLVQAWFDAPVASAVGMSVLRAAVSALVLFAIRDIYRRLRGREGIGLGDVKLAGVAGAWLDGMTVVIVLEIAALAALALYAVRQAMSGRPLRATGRLPFGLTFAPAIWIGWLLEATILMP